MGNIQTLGRYALIGGTRQQIDSLKYTYEGNRHRQIDDLSASANKNLGFDEQGNQAINEITYDPVGKGNVDGNKKATMTYSVIDTIQKVVFTAPTASQLDYEYDRTGNKLKKKYTVGTSITTTDYVNGIQYDTPPGGTRTLSFIQTEEGRVKKNGSTYTYEYDLKDHLGNIRVTIGPDPADASQTTAKVLQESSYYAFGMEMPGTELNYVSGTKNKYLYNGKELQEELGQLDYGARFYDPAIGRWNGMDPIAEIYDDLSPYNYALNNPVRFTDPDGLSVADSVKKSDPKPIPLKEVTITGKSWVKAAGVVLFGTAARTGTAWGITAADPEPFTKTALGIVTAAYSIYVIGSEIYKYNKASVNSEKTVDDLTNRAKHLGRTGKGTEEYEDEGGMAQADKDYDDLVVPGTSRSMANGRYGKTADGKNINVRSKSSSRKETPGVPGPPTLEIYNPNTRLPEIKIRYK